MLAGQNPLRFGRAAALILAGLIVACGEGEEPTWSGEVSAIVTRHCAACHRPDGPAPMSLLSWNDAAPLAARMAQVTAERRMPPWPPARDAGLRFRNERILTDREIRVLGRWAEAGAPRGGPEPERLMTDRTGWSLGEPDLVLEMAGRFTVPASSDHDLFRNFVLQVPLERPRWVRAVELLPDNPRVVHHAILKVDPTRTSRLADEVDSLPGFDALVVESAARPPAGFFAGWTPGLVPTPFPPGTAWRLEPGMDFVVNVHLWPTGAAEQLSLRIGLYFAENEPTRIPTLLRLGAQTIRIPPGDDVYVVEDTFRIPVAVKVLGAYPHAHFLARTVSAWAEMPAGGRVPLMEIPSWDFHRQEVYFYEEPIEMPAGTTLRMRYRYDNSASNPHNPHSPPRTVLWGLESTDEMAEFWLQVVTDNDADRERLNALAQARDVEKQVQGWQYLAAIDPRNADVQAGLADVAHARGQLTEALERYDLALAVRPGMTSALYGRGLVLEELGDLEGARAAFRVVLSALPTHLGALTDLGRLHLAMGDTAAALARLERAVALDPSFPDALNNLGSVLLAQGRLEEAARRLRRGIRLRPDFPEAHFNLALALVSLGRTSEGLQALHRGVDLDGSQLQPVVSVAWILATHPAAGVRHPRAAADLALQLRQVTGPDPVVSDVAAAAFAGMGAFADAVQLADEAIAAAERRGATGLLAELRARRGLYARGEPYVQESTSR